MAKIKRHQQVRRVLLITLAANILVAVGKLVVGWLTSSMAMIADGVHSSLDGTSNIIGLAGSAIAARPPDEDHPYGHRRFETLASMVIGVMLILTAWEIVKNSLTRLASGSTPEITALNFIVMLITLAINLGVAFYERREARRLRSELLLADSEHTGSDILVSVTVLASLVAVRLGWGWMDAGAALVVVGIIGVAAWKIVSRAVNILTDKAALNPPEVSAVVAMVADVQAVRRIRSRGPEDDIHLDLEVEVPSPTTTEQGEAIAEEIRRALREAFTGLSDIQIHFTSPHEDGPPDYARIARAEGDALGLGVHEVIPIREDGRLLLDMHVEVKREQTVQEAHDLVTVLEKRLHAAIPELHRIVTHIEPAHPSQDGLLTGSEARRLAGEALQVARKLYPDNYWHDLNIRAEADGGFAVSMHCHVEGDMALEDAHRLAEAVETQIRASFSAIHRVTIHTEPPE